jgi:5'(3')-deoxyribonucleotidase
VKRKRAIFDSDGFLSAFTESALEVVFELTGKRFVPADVKRFDFCDAIGLSKPERRLVMETIRLRRGFVTGMKPLPGAVNGVNALRAMFDVYVATKPWPKSPTWVPERTAWLGVHFGIDEDHVLPIGAKHLIDGDLFVDDASEQVRAWLAERPTKCGVFWGTPHNTNEAVPAGAHYVTTWPSLIDLARECIDPQRRMLA